ncbi:hypothetical protein HBE96_18420 [Clostridium sp. P21]|uniref:HTH luxR-type domain-containing protein n=1 Tax=Clostridium muellerianum TaxID=2716538 RepID=A0A7Y0EJF2_9CLOT|nr:LuxR C-terminal-related transcriptional regulator [Clostridium muellerianum]NMM64584.1 hypothetical protein [Clostridium muellerianum]
MENNINLLATKFSINHVYRLKAVARNKLFEILDDSVNSDLTFINAPAGFGKTTLLSSWITMHKKKSMRAAWLTLDEEDNDETRFWIYVVSAIKAVLPNIGGKAAKLLSSSKIGGMETIITVLINEIQETKKSFLFIIEDLHLIKNKEILNCLKFFMNNIPQNIHLVITSRREISSVISGIKVYGRIIEIGQEELRFTKEETAAFINEVMELKASEKDLVKLYELTEGWPAGLQIVALFCKRKGIDAIKNKKSMMIQTQFENYFIEDVVNSQPEDVYEFLIKTSLLDTFSYELCACVTGIPNCSNILNKVLEMNLFISCLEDKENWYKYHNLFTSFLKKRIEKEQPDLSKEIYMKAGQWYESRGYKQEACSYYLKGKSFEKAVILMEEVSTDLIYRGQFTLLEKWIQEIPVHYLYKSSRLMLDFVWIYLSKHKIEDAKYYIEIIENEFEIIKKDDKSTFKGEFLIAKAFVSMDNLEQSINLLKRAMELTERFNPNYPAALMSIATSYIIHGEFLEAEQYYFKALTASKKIENLYSAAYSWGSLGMMMTCQGRFSETEALYKEAEEYLKERGGRSIPLLGLVFSGRSEIYYFKNELEKAYDFSVKAEELFEKGGIFDIKNNCYAIKARTLLAKGDKLRAIETINRAMILSQKDKIYGFKRHIDYCKARMFLDMDELDQAADFIEDYNLSFEESIKKYNLHDYILLAEILIKRKKFERGISCIENIMKFESIGKMYEVQLRILKTDALLSTSEHETAYDELHKALIDCSKENYVRIFINYGNRIKDILKLFIDTKSDRYESRSIEYAKYILKFFDNKPMKIARNTILTKRELEVLKLISKGLSNEEIAKNLFISISTVKSHTLNIFGKLEVNSRSKAVVEAERMGVI